MAKTVRKLYITVPASAAEVLDEIARQKGFTPTALARSYILRGIREDNTGIIQ